MRKAVTRCRLGGASARRAGSSLAAFLAGALAFACAPAASAQTAPAPLVPPSPWPAAPAPAAPPPPPVDLVALSKPVDFEARLFGSLEFGRGFRFNNPYRLQTELGSDAKSVSLTPTYVDLGVAAAFGPPDGLQHGGALHASFSLTGVNQAVLVPSYLLAYRGSHDFMAFGRAGPAIVVTPDPTVGGEVAGGFSYFVTGKLGVVGELCFDVFYGAGTHDVGVATYPVLSFQLGLLLDHEILP